MQQTRYNIIFRYDTTGWKSIDLKQNNNNFNGMISNNSIIFQTEFQHGSIRGYCGVLFRLQYNIRFFLVILTVNLFNYELILISFPKENYLFFLGALFFNGYLRYVINSSILQILNEKFGHCNHFMHFPSHGDLRFSKVYCFS